MSGLADASVLQAEAPEQDAGATLAQLWPAPASRQPWALSDSLGPLPSELPSFSEPPCFEPGQALSWHGQEDAGRTQPTGQPQLLGGQAESDDSPGAMEAGLEQAAQWALQGLASQALSQQEEAQVLDHCWLLCCPSCAA